MGDIGRHAILPTRGNVDGSQRRKVTILGGGLSGLTAAWELSRTPELRARYDVTVYQLGWRLGGKLASGRNPSAGWRNEEHGLHVWFGFYVNTFALSSDVLERWHRPDGCPLRDLGDIVQPHGFATFLEDTGRGSRAHRVFCAQTDRHPGEGTAVPDAAALLAALIDALRCVPQQLADCAGIDPAALRGATANARRGRGWRPSARQPRWLAGVDALAARLGDALGRDAGARKTLAHRLHRAAHRTRRSVQRLIDATPSNERSRHLLYRLDTIATSVAALTAAEHEIYLDGDLDRVANFELRDWLRHHGAHPDTLSRCVVLAGQYDAFFQFADSDRNSPSFEASSAMRIMLRGLVGYHGSIAWLLQDGMGEALIAPMYEVLRDQGVRFCFFHKVEHLGLSADGGGLESVALRQQARCRGTYEPLVTWKGQRVWLSEPDWDQLEDGDALRARGVRFESRFSPPDANIPVTLRRGVDFDDVVLALPLGALVPTPDGETPAADWFRAHPRILDVATRINLQTSVAAQLWLRRPMTEFGWRSTAALVGWGADYSIACDMTQVLEHEGWSDDGPVSCVYLCGVAPIEEAAASSADVDAVARGTERARALLARHLESRGGDVLGTPGLDFDWDVLFDGQGGEGADRLAAQYLRANIEPWDLCDSATPGTARLRPEAHESGLENMALASTWVRTGLNTTCVEAAVMSGMAAARALGVGGRTIHGEDFLARPMKRATLRSVAMTGDDR